MDRHDLFVDGARRPAASGRYAPSEDPAAEAPWCEVASASPADVDRAVQAARRAFRQGAWRDLSPEARGEVLQRVADLVQDHADELAMGEITDGGATLRKAYTADISATAETFQVYAELGVSEQGERVDEGDVSVPAVHRVRHEPIGVIGAIVPFNFPLAAAAWKIAPALAAGNSVVVKPSPYTPVTALRLAELCAEAGVPDGVVSVIASDDHAVGSALVGHPDVDKVAFTGSTHVGRRVMATCAEAPKPVLLELGGKSANVVLHDAALQVAAAGALFGTFFHAGQVCQSGTRVLVDRRVHDAFLAEMIALAGRIRVGHPMDPETTLGPLISAAQRDRVLGFVARAKEAGASVALGGGRPAGMDVGYYVEPTILTGVTGAMEAAREEIFGPVVCVIPFDAEDEALRVANDSDYGLTAAVWSRDIDRASRLAERIDAGTVWINDYHLLSPRYPFGGYKRSGFGRELGPEGLRAYQQVKHIHVGEPGTLEEKHYLSLILGEEDG